MTVIIVERPADLAAHLNQRLGPSSSVRIDQAMIDSFAELTGDRQWLHVDVGRAGREMPDGKTIAHGLLVLSLAPKLKDDCYAIRGRGKGLNYGYDRIRFIRPVRAGDEIHLMVTLTSVAPHRGGTRIEALHEIEIVQTGEVAISAQNIMLIEDA